MIFITDILIHFVIRKHFSNQRWWLFKFSKGYPLELSPFWAKNEILNIQNLTSNNKMYQNSRLKSPKTSTCLFVKKCHISCLELGNIKLMTLYMDSFLSKPWYDWWKVVGVEKVAPQSFLLIFLKITNPIINASYFKYLFLCCGFI